MFSFDVSFAKQIPFLFGQPSHEALADRITLPHPQGSWAGETFVSARDDAALGLARCAKMCRLHLLLKQTSIR